jgi:hypothetical protein
MNASRVYSNIVFLINVINRYCRKTNYLAVNKNAMRAFSPFIPATLPH